MCVETVDRKLYTLLLCLTEVCRRENESVAGDDTRCVERSGCYIRFDEKMYLGLSPEFESSFVCLHGTKTEWILYV
jgi:hypothetical protein